MGEIHIFVSHRIDIDSELPEDPIYIPVRCGAVFDKDKRPRLAGDDTGDHISEKRMSFCEFTVQYWAWKNIDADYYGLCHYRRYLSFSDKRFKTDEYNMVYVPVLTNHYAKKYVISANAKNLIRDYDVVVSEYADVHRIPAPRGKVNTVLDLWRSYNDTFIEESSIDLMMRLIAQRQPDYLESAKEYLSGGLHRGFNCYVLRKDLFREMCALQFDIMFEIERRLDMTEYSETMKRTPAFIGEILYGIYIYHLEKQGTYKIKELQLVFFNRTNRVNTRLGALKRFLWICMELLLRRVFDPIMPKGTKRREFAKKIFYGVLHTEPRGAAHPKR